jgi:hypothetical protein
MISTIPKAVTPIPLVTHSRLKMGKLFFYEDQNKPE